MPRGNGAPIGGVEFVTWNGWFAARTSGTEAVHKVYADTTESTTAPAAVDQSPRARSDHTAPADDDRPLGA